MQVYNNSRLVSGTSRDMLESKIIAFALLGQEQFLKIQYLVPKDFKDHMHRQAWELIKSKKGVTKHIIRENIELAAMYADEIWYIHHSILAVQLVEVNIYEGYQVFLKSMATSIEDPGTASEVMKTMQEAAVEDPLRVHRVIIKHMTFIDNEWKKKLKVFHSRVQKRIEEIKKITDNHGFT